MAGSMAFVRAFHSDPPMKPMFARYYHLQNDELLGSWFFLFAIIPGNLIIDCACSGYDDDSDDDDVAMMNEITYTV